jgi:hypothetical protein
MSKFLTPESVATRPDASFFPPERLQKLNRVFARVCADAQFLTEEQRDELASYLLLASKFTTDEEVLVAVLRIDLAGYSKSPGL